MSRAVNAVVIGIAVFILLAGSFWYLSVARGAEKLEVDADLSLESADSSRTRFLADIRLTNRHDVDVQLHSFAYELAVDELVLVKNATTETVPLKAREERKESVVLSFSTDFVSEWLKNHVEAGEKSTVRFFGNATFQVGSRNQTVEFSEQSPFSTELRASLGEARNCPRPSPEPCVEGAGATWRELNKTRVLELSLDLKNPGGTEIKVDRPKASLQWAGVEVAKAEAGGLILPADGSEPMEFVLFLEHEQLTLWWPKHLQQCEVSPVALTVSFTYVVQPEDKNTTSPSPTTVSTPPTFTPPTNTTTPTSSSPSPTTSSASPTNTSASPTTSTPTSTTTTPPPTTSTSPTPSSSTVPTNTTVASTSMGGMSVHQVRYVFLFEPEEAPESHAATWDLEAKDLQTRFVCAEAEPLIALP
jgi:LEA14-like dessication related protein